MSKPLGKGKPGLLATTSQTVVVFPETEVGKKLKVFRKNENIILTVLINSRYHKGRILNGGTTTQKKGFKIQNVMCRYKRTERKTKIGSATKLQGLN